MKLVSIVLDWEMKKTDELYFLLIIYRKRVIEKKIRERRIQRKIQES